MNEIISREKNETTNIELFSFLGLIDNYKIVIPRLQRDYALGREGEEEKRKYFLDSLKSYLNNDDESMRYELDFTYGSMDKDTLTLLDGQQRLTTLFLLHWYLSLLDEKFDNFRNKIYKNSEYCFTYDTRYSSTDFCKIISTLKPDSDVLKRFQEFITDKSKRPVKKKKCKKEVTIKLSEFIKKEKFFLYDWNYDPTIKSMLKVLDDIDDKFNGQKGHNLFDKLENGKISFHFLELKNFGLSDELYIKMNSRGKQLTKFENLKAKILLLFDEAEKNSPDQYKKKLDEIKQIDPNVSSLREYFSKMMDTKWIYIFWNEWKDYEKKKDEKNVYVDNMLMSFIFNFCIYSFILNYPRDGKNLKIDLGIFLNKIDDKKKEYTLAYSEYEDILKGNNYKTLFTLIEAFNVICDEENSKLKKYFDDDFIYFNEKNAFKVIVDSYNKVTYEQRVEYFAYLKYLIENKNQLQIDLFKKWMRFITNICVNSYQINQDSGTLSTSILQIDNTLYRQDIEKITEDDCKNISVFDRPQIDEEILKMKLSHFGNWDRSLLQAEKELQYFNRNLYYPLHLTLTSDPTDWNLKEELDSEGIKCEDFNKKIEILKKIFVDKDGCRFESSLIRALLTKGDYLTKIYQKSYSLLKNKSRDLGWTEVFRKKDNETNAFKKCFYDVITDSDFNKDDVKKSLDTIANKRVDNLEKWKLAIIDCSQILDSKDKVSKNRYIRWNANSTTIDRSNIKKDTKSINCEIDILSGEKINSYHWELFTLQKYYDLLEHYNLGDNDPKNKLVIYKPTTNEVDQPHILFNKKIRIYYAYDYKFILREEQKTDEFVDFENLEKVLEEKLQKTV